MGTVSREIVEKLWRGANPFLAFPSGLYQGDVQGWNSQHPYLAEAIVAVRPSVVVEVGVWKGGSSLFMANQMRALGLDAAMISVDTWLGSWDHWINDEWFGELSVYPRTS